MTHLTWPKSCNRSRYSAQVLVLKTLQSRPGRVTHAIKPRLKAHAKLWGFSSQVFCNLSVMAAFSLSALLSAAIDAGAAWERVKSYTTHMVWPSWVLPVLAYISESWPRACCTLISSDRLYMKTMVKDKGESNLALSFKKYSTIYYMLYVHTRQRIYFHQILDQKLVLESLYISCTDPERISIERNT